jgi:thiol-disulfide isomerase/thioredoxin
MIVCYRLIVVIAVLGLTVMLGGCGSEEELVPDAGVSPFYPGPGASGNPSDSQSSSGSLPQFDRGPNPEIPGDAERRAAASALLDDPERRVKAAFAAMERGEPLVAAQTLDEVLGADPLNREALLLRAVIALDQSRTGSESERALEVGRAADLMRSLRKAHPRLDSKEREVLSKALAAEASILISRKELDSGFAILTEAVDAGFFESEMLGLDPAYEAVRDDPRYHALVSRMVEGAKEASKARVGALLAKRVNFPFTFSLKDPDGKTVSLSDYKGQVVLVDFWGTWCGPCIQSLPHLVRLHELFASKGLAIVGLNYEKVPPEMAPSVVKEFLNAAKLPYPCLIGDDETQDQVPAFEGYPTTLILDRNGTIRYRSVGFQPSDAKAMEDVIRVLLDDSPAPAPAPPSGDQPGPAPAERSQPAPAEPKSE